MIKEATVKTLPVKEEIKQTNAVIEQQQIKQIEHCLEQLSNEHNSLQKLM
jgi:hypothetical protein